ncbi:hypothetical protein [Paraglaciecola sp.]|uniref:hypothetical protein n=1 Tax=Paraglaciecola sp. TaxID=1920173 RepID=UPI0030F415CE
MTSIVDPSSFNDSVKSRSKPQFTFLESSNPVGLMLLDLLGFALILYGLALQYNNLDALPEFLQFTNIGLVILGIGILMTLPFLAWVLKACERALKNITP